MKPDWDKLMLAFESSATVLVADVDCTSQGGEGLCEEHGVQGYPSLMYGDPSDLQSYEGGRDLASLKKHAEGLKPLCSPKNIDLCDEDKKARIKELQAMSPSTLRAKVEEETKKIEAATTLYNEEVQKLQNRYQELGREKDATVQAVKDGGLGLMKAVLDAAPRDEL
eukprot:NODE_797_length_1360_cov_284.849808.p1 GENE.NODE_797_length_1360_cov_284.849808~~NODE_797_length_1360_cov_284.849808.p1  ORF type:complete len:167 (+),score=61.73 NODE_797_length_1360_cov_284.849808:239-739(+)